MYISHSIIHQKNPYIIQLYVPFCLLRPLKKAVPHLLSGTSKKKNLLEWKKKKNFWEKYVHFFFNKMNHYENDILSITESLRI